MLDISYLLCLLIFEAVKFFVFLLFCIPALILICLFGQDEEGFEDPL